MTACSSESSLDARDSARSASPGAERGKPRLAIGVTSDQTCLVLRGRLRALRLAGFEVTLISAPGETLTRLAGEEGVNACPVAMRRGISPVADMISLVAIWRILQRLRPSITDFSTPKAGLLGNLAAWSLGIPHRIYTLRGLKLEGSKGVKRLLLLAAEQATARCAHRVLCNSLSLRAAAGVLRIAPERKLCLLGDGSSNGVDAEQFSPSESRVREALGISENDFVLGFVGRLTRDKGVPELLIAFEEILHREPRCRLLLVGWFDDAEDALERRWREHILSHPRISYTGFVLDTAPYYRAMDLFVLPTHREGFPNVALEASSCGLAVITTESTGARDAVLPEVTGLLIPPGIPEAIREAALALIADAGKRRRLGEAGRARVLERYTKERVLGLAVQFYRELLMPE